LSHEREWDKKIKRKGGTEAHTTKETRHLVDKGKPSEGKGALSPNWTLKISESLRGTHWDQHTGGRLIE